jgi:hypothetical protein
METLIYILKEYGVWGFVLLVVAYLVLNSQFTIQYPRPKKK